MCKTMAHLQPQGINLVKKKKKAMENLLLRNLRSCEENIIRTRITILSAHWNHLGDFFFNATNRESWPAPGDFDYIGLEYAAAAKSLQPCPTLCDPIDSSPSSVQSSLKFFPGIQSRAETLRIQTGPPQCLNTWYFQGSTKMFNFF